MLAQPPRGVWRAGELAVGGDASGRCENRQHDLDGGNVPLFRAQLDSTELQVTLATQGVPTSLSP